MPVLLQIIQFLKIVYKAYYFLIAEHISVRQIIVFYLKFCKYKYMSAMDVDEPVKPSKLTIFKCIT